jgi:two-component system nitrate/nitrite response regulator NarL
VRAVTNAAQMNELRVLILARDRLARAGLSALLDQQPGCVVVGQVGEYEELAPGLKVYQPDVVLWELEWDATGDLEYLAGMPEDAPPVLALLPDDSHAADAWAAGARGLILRDTDAERLLSALVAVGQGFGVLDLSLTAAVPPIRSVPAGNAPNLTPRELEALRLIADGLPNKAIASRLGISEHTVKFHVNSILSKLAAQSRTEAVTNAARFGLIFL